MTNKDFLKDIKLWIKRLFCKCNKMQFVDYEKDENGKITLSKWECIKCKKVYYQWEIDTY